MAQDAILHMLSSVDITSLDVGSNDVVIAVDRAIYSNFTNSSNNLMLLLLGTLVFMLLIRYLYLNFTDGGRAYKKSLKALVDPSSAYGSNNKYTNISSSASQSWMDLFAETDSALTGNKPREANPLLLYPPSSSAIVLEKPVVHEFMPFVCKFKADPSLELVYANDNFYNLFNLKNRSELQRHYFYVSQIKSGKLEPSIPFNSIEHLKYKKDDPTSSYIITINDIFSISAELFNTILELSNGNINTSNHIISSGVMDLKDLNESTNITIKYELTLADTDEGGKVVVVSFHINSILPKVNTAINYSILSSPLQKEVLKNLLIDLPIPIMFINKNGIKFVNKSTYDWFNIPYDHQVSSEGAKDGMELDVASIVDKIHPDLTDTIHEIMNTPTKMKPFFREYNVANQHKNISDQLHLKEPSRVIAVHIEPYEDDSNEKQIMLEIVEATPVRKYMMDGIMAASHLSPSDTSAITTRHQKNDLIELSSIGGNFTIEKVNLDTSICIPADMDDRTQLYINELKEKWEFFKNFFANTQMVSFGRINVSTREIIACNDSFEELLRFATEKDCYLDIVNKLIASFPKSNDSLRNYYMYDLHYSNREVRLVYTYNINLNIIDIVFVERDGRAFITNDSMELLGSLYETSDLPVVTVNKKSEILTRNKIFDEWFLSKKKAQEQADLTKRARKKKCLVCPPVEEENSTAIPSLIDLVPEKDKNKVRRAISDAIKFNSSHHHDTISMIMNNGIPKNCVFKCIKSYSKIGDTEIITITIFPLNDDN